MSSEHDRDGSRFREFERLTEDERRDAARRLAAAGYSDTDVGIACRVSTEQARRWIGPRPVQQR